MSIRVQPTFCNHTCSLMSVCAELNTSPSSPGASGASAGAVGGGDSEEKYEKGIPIHGDVMFHNFVTTIQENPGQILR